jgi:hypothetical protein
MSKHSRGLWAKEIIPEIKDQVHAPQTIQYSETEGVQQYFKVFFKNRLGSLKV